MIALEQLLVVVSQIQITFLCMLWFLVIIRTEGYVIVNCSLRFFQDQTSLNIYNIQPITNMNIITEHLLNCIICYDFYKKRAGVVWIDDSILTRMLIVSQCKRMIIWIMQVI